MSCNICYTEDSNIYKCSTCTGLLCGKCFITWKKKNDSCPLCRKPMKYIDPNCPEFFSNSDKKKNKKPDEFFHEEHDDLYVDWWYNETSDKWDYEIPMDIVYEGVEYFLKSKIVEFEGVMKPRIKYLNVTYCGNGRIVDTIIKKDGVKYLSRRMVKNDWSYTKFDGQWKDSLTTVEGECKFVCKDCNKGYVGEKTLINHIKSKHQKQGSG